MLVVTVVLQIVRIVNEIHRFGNSVTKLSFNLWHRIVVVVIDVLGGVRVVVLFQVRMVVLDPVVWIKAPHCQDDKLHPVGVVISQG